jgi:hypothetical protein
MRQKQQLDYFLTETKKFLWRASIMIHIPLSKHFYLDALDLFFILKVFFKKLYLFYFKLIFFDIFKLTSKIIF